MNQRTGLCYEHRQIARCSASAQRGYQMCCSIQYIYNWNVFMRRQDESTLIFNHLQFVKHLHVLLPLYILH